MNHTSKLTVLPALTTDLLQGNYSNPHSQIKQTVRIMRG